ncbi:MFS transporter [Streptomyces sp. NPDC056503]|uniref:MFS transporter n=1 Tax=Streptomyces sp. NPDC056503 TaxID=3345842 RepID=UPI0036B2416A
MTETPDAPDTTASGEIPGPLSPAGLPALRRRVQAVLVATQILGGLGIATGVALAAVLATEVSGTDALAGLASTATVAGPALLAMPLAALMTRRGRRAGLVLAYLLGALGAGVVVLGAVLDSFPVLLTGLVGFGAGSSANLAARFAAADLAEPDRRARAISTVVWATSIGAVLGPNIAAPAGRSVSGLGIPVAAGPFLWAAVVFLVSALVVTLLLRPDPLLTARALAAGDETGDEVTAAAGVGSAGRDGSESRDGSGAADRSKGRALRDGLRAVRESPRARIALVTVAASHTVMVSIMSMTPVALTHHGAGIELIGLVISVHIAGMYAFSPVMGWLSDRLGRLAVIGLAVGLLGLAALLAGTAGASHPRTAAGLFVLGLGWSAGLVSGSALLTDSVPQAARAAVQGLSDTVMNAAAGIGGLVAGVIVSRTGYGPLNALAACLLLPMAALALRGVLRRA